MISSIQPVRTSASATAGGRCTGRRAAAATRHTTAAPNSPSAASPASPSRRRRSSPSRRATPAPAARQNTTTKITAEHAPVMWPIVPSPSPMLRKPGMLCQSPSLLDRLQSREHVELADAEHGETDRDDTAAPATAAPIRIERRRWWRPSSTPDASANGSSMQAGQLDRGARPRSARRSTLSRCESSGRSPAVVNSSISRSLWPPPTP